MTDTLPPPLVPAEVVLRDFAFMPLDVQRLRDSDLASDETPEACWAAVLLWCAAWHQIPAGSIPATDSWQAKQCGYVSQGRIAPAWKKVRPGALRGWVACSDGRLYHPVVAEKANEAWRQKLAQRWRSECARIKKHNQRHKLDLPMPEFEAWLSAGCPQGQPLFVPGDTASMSPGTDPPRPQSVPRETPSKRQGPERTETGTGLTGVGEADASPSSAGPTPDLLGDTGEGTGKAAPTVPCPYGAIVDAYHAALPSLPQVLLRDGKTWVKRQKAMRSLWGWVLSSRRTDGTRRAESAEQAMVWIRSYFARAAENDFVMGRTARSAEHANWRADFDYLLTESGLRQVIEKTRDAA